mmetsp:Transcript_100455/g.324183  ORF Transcript_100455/g.324183 Transcript_100455/m.324183 type:complete len:386 (-) Transcript_100455:299-1456(-)
MGQQPCLGIGSPLADAVSTWRGFGFGPVTDKDSSQGWSQSLGLLWGVSCMQGWRDSMEDAHLAIPHLHGWRDTAVFGVMDGHGGEQVARFCEQHLPQELARRGNQDVPVALTSAFHQMDVLLADPRSLHELRALSRMPKGAASPPPHPDLVGCTAIVCCVRRDTITVANAGDCRAVLCRRGRAVDMSEDHKPNLPAEAARIQRAGGCVLPQRLPLGNLYRVNGDLSLSRAIGDLRYKQNPRLGPQEQIVSCTPDVRTFGRQPDDEFMIVACDGVWDVMSSQQAVDYVRQRLLPLLEGSVKPSTVAEGLLDNCLSPDPAKTFGLGGDNMTLLIVVFQGGPEEMVVMPRRIPVGATMRPGPGAAATMRPGPGAAAPYATAAAGSCLA